MNAFQLNSAWALRNKIKSPVNLLTMIMDVAPDKLGIIRPFVNYYWGTTWTINTYSVTKSDVMSGVQNIAY
jgi:hypothetical protein